MFLTALTLGLVFSKCAIYFIVHFFRVSFVCEKIPFLDKGADDDVWVGQKKKQLKRDAVTGIRTLNGWHKLRCDAVIDDVFLDEEDKKKEKSKWWRRNY